MSSVKPTRYMADNKLMLAKSGMIVIVIIGFTVQTCYMYAWYLCRGVARPGHTRAVARASSYFALPSAAFPAIKMAYKL